jgi:hypothetical protein
MLTAASCNLAETVKWSSASPSASSPTVSRFSAQTNENGPRGVDATSTTGKLCKAYVSGWRAMRLAIAASSAGTPVIHEPISSRYQSKVILGLSPQYATLQWPV